MAYYLDFNVPPNSTIVKFNDYSVEFFFSYITKNNQYVYSGSGKELTVPKEGFLSINNVVMPYFIYDKDPVIKYHFKDFSFQIKFISGVDNKYTPIAMGMKQILKRHPFQERMF